MVPDFTISDEFRVNSGLIPANAKEFPGNSRRFQGNAEDFSGNANLSQYHFYMNRYSKQYQVAVLVQNVLCGIDLHMHSESSTQLTDWQELVRHAENTIGCSNYLTPYRAESMQTKQSICFWSICQQLSQTFKIEKTRTYMRVTSNRREALLTSLSLFNSTLKAVNVAIYMESYPQVKDEMNY